MVSFNALERRVVQKNLLEFLQHGNALLKGDFWLEDIDCSGHIAFVMLSCSTGGELNDLSGWPFYLLVFEFDMEQKVTDFLDILFPFWLEIFSQDLLKVFKAILVHTDNSSAIWSLSFSFSGCIGFSFYATILSAVGEEKFAMFSLSLSSLMSISWAQIKQMRALVPPS